MANFFEIGKRFPHRIAIKLDTFFSIFPISGKVRSTTGKSFILKKCLILKNESGKQSEVFEAKTLWVEKLRGAILHDRCLPLH
jgi:hypothetical protein